MSDHSETAPSETQGAHLALFVLGGLCLGTGAVSLYGSFGAPSGPLNGNLRVIGFTGLDNLTSFNASDYSIPLVVVGLVCLIYGNAIAWRHTNGY